MSIAIVDTNENKAFYATEDAVGFDIVSNEEGLLSPGEFRIYRTGLYMDVDQNKAIKDFELQIRPRSGMAANHGITVLNAPGTIDPLYPKEIGVLLINHGKQPHFIAKGDRIAQGVVAAFARAKGVKEGVEVRTGGFGSTGSK